MEKPTKKEVIRIAWSCGAPDCKTAHQSEGSAMRCPRRKAALVPRCQTCNHPLMQGENI